jgi:hypothetical protein
MTRDMTMFSDIFYVTENQDMSRQSSNLSVTDDLGKCLGKLILYLSQMSRDMSSLSDTLSVTYNQGYKLGKPILYMSQMTRDMARLTNTLNVTNVQGCDLAHRYIICHK